MTPLAWPWADIAWGAVAVVILAAILLALLGARPIVFRSLFPSFQRLRRQGGELRATGCLFPLGLIVGIIYPTFRVRRVRRERKR